MPTEENALEQLRAEFDNFAALRFPDLPESEELADYVFKLLTLDPQVAGKVTRLLNGNMSRTDLSSLEKINKDLHLLRRDLRNAYNPKANNSGILDGLIYYVTALCKMTDNAIIFARR